MIPISVLDLSRIIQGATAAEALSDSLEIAQHAERLGYQRIWFAEHHNMVGVASSATAVIIAYVAGATKRIRVGSGGVMLPNHAPLVIAEQFGTLASIYPDRIDLGLGRAPGTDMATARALRRDMSLNANSFPQDVVELQTYFDDVKPGLQIRAVPGAGLKVPLWLLGSSIFSAQLAAQLGLPYAFAAHFAPDEMEQALYIAIKQIDRYFGLLQAAHLLAEIDPCAVVLPGPVIQVTGNHHEIDLLVDGFGDEVGEGVSRSHPQHPNRSVFVGAQTRQGAIEVYVCRVDEFHELLRCSNHGNHPR